MLQRAKLAGVNEIILAGVTAATWPRLLKQVTSHPQLYACLGLHPLFIAEHQAADLIELKHQLVIAPKVIALGEIGIDLHSPGLQAQEAK